MMQNTDAAAELRAHTKYQSLCYYRNPLKAMAKTCFLFCCIFKTRQWCRWMMRADDVSLLANICIIQLQVTGPLLHSPA